MGKMPDMDSTQHINMDYTQNLRENPSDNETFTMIFMLQNQEFANFIEFGQNCILKGNFGNWQHRNDKKYMNSCHNQQNMAILTYISFVHRIMTWALCTSRSFMSISTSPFLM